jgi:tetratricopeptide (TPR) repeat protein
MVRLKTGLALLALGSAVLGVHAPAGAQGQGGAPYAPFAGKPGNEPKDPAYEKIAAAIKKLEKDFKAKPKDAKLKKQVAEAHYKAGMALEYSKAGISPRARYRGALKHYNTTLKLQPDHKEAAKEKKQIEDIYTSMGMPIPK